LSPSAKWLKDTSPLSGGEHPSTMSHCSPNRADAASGVSPSRAAQHDNRAARIRHKHSAARAHSAPQERPSPSLKCAHQGRAQLGAGSALFGVAHSSLLVVQRLLLHPKRDPDHAPATPPVRMFRRLYCSRAVELVRVQIFDRWRLTGRTWHSPSGFCQIHWDLPS
jgi:hypothetical protein